jgi:uridylate kinase
MPRYKRVLLKLSGGALAGTDGFGFDPGRLDHICNEVLSLTRMDVEVAIVVGGGNIFRGRLAENWGIERAEADNIGTLATIINSLLLRGALKAKTEQEIRVMTAIPINAVAEPYIRLRAIHHLEKGYIVIFAGGNGQPYVTTDYPAVQRAVETRCDAILVAKHGVDGVYDRDPFAQDNAKRYVSVNYNDVISLNLNVMDQSAVLLARDYQLPIHVFDFAESDAARMICCGNDIGTIIHSGETVKV